MEALPSLHLSSAGISRLLPYNRDNPMLECKVRSGPCRTNSMNINELWRRAANPEAEIWLPHTLPDGRGIHQLDGSEESNNSFTTALLPALLTSGLKSSEENRNFYTLWTHFHSFTHLLIRYSHILQEDNPSLLHWILYSVVFWPVWSTVFTNCPSMILF